MSEQNDDITAMAKAMWSTKQARYRFSNSPNLKDWDDIPEDSKDWMMAEARAGYYAYKYEVRKRSGEVGVKYNVGDEAGRDD